jgi:multimeric flavodoxin WrbA
MFAKSAGGFMKQVLVLMSSPRKGGNTDRLCDAFIRGTQEAGHNTEKIYVRDKNINGCLCCLSEEWRQLRSEG